MKTLAAILLAAFIGAAAAGQTPASLGVAVHPTTSAILAPTNLFEANSNALQRTLGVTNIPAALLARAFQAETIAALTNLNWQSTPSLATNAAAIALWRSTRGDRGGGLLRLDTTSTATVDDGLVFPANPSGRWIRWRPDGSRRISVDWWGPAADGLSDDTAAIRSAGSAVQAQGGGVLEAPGPRYLVRGGNPGAVVVYWSNLTDVRVDAPSALFMTDDFGTNTFLQTSLSISGITATATSSVAHNLIVGDTLIVRDATDEGYDGPYVVTAAPATNVLRFDLSGFSTPTLTATGLVRKAHQGNVLFRLKNCRNVDFGTLRFAGTVQPVHSQYRLGWIVVQPVYGSREIKGDLRVTGAAYGVWSGDYDLATGDCDNLDMTVAGEDMGYPVSLWDSGHRSRFRIVADRVHRGAYVGGVHDTSFQIQVSNPDVAGILITHQPLGGASLTGCENIDADVLVTADQPISLHGVGSSRYIAIIGAYPIDTPATHRNIRLRIRAKDAIDTTGLQIIGYSAQHRLDGLEISGFVDQRGISTNDVRHDLYVDQLGSAGMAFRNIKLRDLTFLHPADGVGAFNSTFKAAHMETDLVIDDYRSAMPRNFVLPTGCRVVSVPTFAGGGYDSLEAGILQRLAGGVTLGGNLLTNSLSASPGSGDLTMLWTGTVPASGNLAIGCITTNPFCAAPGSLGLLLTNGALGVRLWGATTNDYRLGTVAGWQAAHGGRAAAVGVVRTPAGLRVWTDGQENALSEVTAGSAPAWTNSIAADRAILGAEVTNLWYVGTVYRFGVWNLDKSAEFPGLAIAGGGTSTLGDSTNTMDSATNDGSFEAAGAGGADVFASWTEGALGTSFVTNSTTVSEGTRSLAFVVDGSNSYAAAYQTNRMVIGASYRISLDARVLSGGTGGAINLVGATDGETTIQITDQWATYTVTKIWGGTTFLVKRSDAAGRTILVDNIRIRRVGALLDHDFVAAPADLLTGRWPGIDGVTARMVPRGAGYSGDRGDVDITLRAGLDAPIQWFGTTLTAPRAVSFSTVGARMGDQFRIVRSAAGTPTLTIGAVTLTTNQWCDVMFTGSGWTNIAAGSTKLP